MVLILEIAAGIVLAVLALAFLREVLIGAAALVGIAIVGLLALLVIDNVNPFLVLLALAGAVYGLEHYLRHQKAKRKAEVAADILPANVDEGTP